MSVRKHSAGCNGVPVALPTSGYRCQQGRFESIVACRQLPNEIASTETRQSSADGRLAVFPDDYQATY
jgi:hypothetical protein